MIMIEGDACRKRERILLFINLAGFGRFVKKCKNFVRIFSVKKSERNPKTYLSPIFNFIFPSDVLHNRF